ncbi:HET-domain-containing protein, partial [Trametes versicolor FP-101664 SS1]|uniref:HET-domain-containing protein n=1 Tax=Trametes versicolor (strain FP-101664) TaxID=717944 RepID=UPI0004621D0C
MYELKEFASKTPRYAILSHRWEKVELTFADVEERNQANKKKIPWTTEKTRAWAKVENACKFAKEKGFDWIWLDMCCINKASSAELQEAINSMFSWYRDAALCLAYLNDVPDLAMEDPQLAESQFRQSEWFTRGWTLQELVAPNAAMVFLSKDWAVIGRRDWLADVITDITSIDVDLLSGAHKPVDFSRWSVAKRMSWAANRTTTRPEDGAYSLAGLFGVSMPIIYGEGGEQAFWRLQREIIRQSSDQSVFAW